MNLTRSLIPDLAIFQAFACAARHGSFTRAAEELNLTQSAVSRQIRALETQLGVVLFERVRKRVVLSEAGRSLLPQVTRLLDQTEEIMRRALAASDGKSLLTIATLPSFGSRWLMRRLPGFLKLHPGISFNIACHRGPFDLSRGDFDVAIHYGQPVWPHASCSYLCDEIITPVASPAFAAREVTPDEIAHGPLLHLSTRPKLWSQWFEAQGLAEVNAFQGHHFDQFNMVIEAALAGAGFALLPRYLIEEEMAAGRLVEACPRPLSTESSYYIVLPEGKRETPAVQTFKGWLLTQVSTYRA